MRPLIITVDGPAGAGKTTVGRSVAKRLGLQFLDTGAMYRGLTVHCLGKGIDPANAPGTVVALARRSSFSFDWNQDPPRLHVDNRDVTDRLRDPDTTKSVSDLAHLAGVRQVLVEIQQRIGREHPRLVSEGRDQGSVVFPSAQVKFYLDATPQVRARRRAAELRESGKPADESQVLGQIIERDRRDSTRRDGPLICPEDATRIDTSPMNLEQVVDLLVDHVRQLVGSVVDPAPRVPRGTP